jgi:hypothetical protein
VVWQEAIEPPYPPKVGRSSVGGPLHRETHDRSSSVSAGSLTRQATSSWPAKNRRLCAIHVRSKASAGAAEDCIQRSLEIAKRKRNEAKSDVVRSGRDLQGAE